MTRRLAKALVITAMVLSLGLHWTVLQTVAWVGMIVDYSAETSFSSSISKTFDGKNQCELCRFVEAGQKQDQEKGRHFQNGKLDLLIDMPPAQVFAPDSLTFSIRKPPSQAGIDAASPPSPPPLA